MAENTINVKVKQRTDTESNWASKNPVLLKGEMAISSDKNNKYKIGDGTSVWSALSYAKADLSKSDVTTALGYTPPTTNTTYNDVTQSAHGLMTAADKKKLDGIASGATAVTDSTVAGWGYKKTDTNTWRPLGTTADTACAGNDSRLSNARPASDVSAWAKASSKPSYSKSEVGLGNVDNTADSAKSVKYATSAGSASSASKATGLVDYNATRQTIQIGYGGSGISGDAIKFIAGYTTGNGSDVNAKIKDVSKDALKSWLGLGSLAYSSATIPTIPSSLPANGGNSTTVNGYTVNSNVPANAKFTDTWRGVQNNLTSTATDQSLSAYQGKVLKDLVDKKTTFTYSSTQPTSPASNAVWIG